MNAIQRKRLSKRRRLCLSAAAACLLALLLTVGDSPRSAATRQDRQVWPQLDEELAQAVGRTAARVREQALPVRTPATRTAARPLAALPARAASAAWLEPLADPDDEAPPSVAMQPAEPQTARQVAEQDPPS